jgi:hypothetical protein
MSAKLRDEIEAKRAKLQELRQARLARQRHDTERRSSGVGVRRCRVQSHNLLSFLTLFPTSLDTRQVSNADGRKCPVGLNPGSG